MAVRLVSQFQPDPSGDTPSPPDSLAAVVERLMVVEQSLAALTTELNRMIDEVTYLRLKIEFAEGDHR
jgi:hypothetical protein